MTRFVVAAVDGSGSDEHTLTWASEEAQLRGIALRVVHVMEWPMQFAEGLHSREVREAGAEQARQLVDRTVDMARADRPGLEVEGWFDVGHVSGVLVERSRETELLVIGAPARHRGIARLFGGTAGHLIGHARCTLAVIPAADRPDASEILVGVDDEPSSKSVIAATFREASLRGVGVHALHAYEWPISLGQEDWVTPLYTADELLETETVLLAEALAGARGDYPELDVKSSVLNAQAAEALIDGAASAALVVVGAQGRGGFAGMLLGSVARSVAYNADCPTLIVRD